MIDILEQFPGYCAWKDEQLKYLGCNYNLANAIGLPHPKKIIGQTDVNLFFECEESLAFYHDSDRLALAGNTLKMIHSIGAHDASKSFYLEKKPLFGTMNNIIGVIFHCHEFEINNLVAILNKYDAKYFPSDLISPKYDLAYTKNEKRLSERELECLFCILRGMTAKKIAETIGLSKRTIEFYTENIKNKFGCLTKTELLLSALKYGYMSIIPARFLNNSFIQLFS